MTDLKSFEQIKKYELTPTGEAVRLSNELRTIPEHPSTLPRSENIIIPEKKGFDIENCTLETITIWLNDTKIKKSKSLLLFVHKIISVRFPTEFSKLSINSKSRISSESNNDLSWFGQSGYSAELAKY